MSEELLCNHRFGRRYYAQAISRSLGLSGSFLCRRYGFFEAYGLIPTFFFSVAAWLVWCGNVYNDKNYSLIPAVMCAAESILLIITGAAIIRRQAESEER